MQYEEFEQLRNLPMERLRKVVSAGDGMERVWAAWELGIRLGADALPSIRGQGDPDAGVRRHFVVLLAGFGERQLLATLAREDPDPAVRATATVYLVRIAPRTDLAQTHDFVTEQLRLESRNAASRSILDALADDWPVVPEVVLKEMLLSGRGDNQYGVVRYAAQRLQQDPSLASTLCAALECTNERWVLQRMLEDFGSFFPRSSLLALAERNPELAPSALDEVCRSGTKLTWKQVSNLPLDDPTIRVRILELVDDDAADEFQI